MTSHLGSGFERARFYRLRKNCGTPPLLHYDPFELILVAQAMVEQLLLLLAAHLEHF
jgi:hypothetical protein